MRYADALVAVDRALALNSDDANAWLTKGHALLKLDRYEESISASDRAVAINPIPVIVTAAQQTKSAALQGLKLHDEPLTVPQPQSFWTRFWGE